jgi:preprotein translocase subunit SecA
MEFQHPQAHGYDEAPDALAEDPQAAADKGAADAPTPFKREGPKVGRNDPCPCGSGKKYKQCHGKLG